MSDCGGVDGQGGLHVPLGSFDSSSLSVFSCFAPDITWLVQNLHIHECSGSIQYGMEQCDASSIDQAKAMHGALDVLLGQFAFPQLDNWVTAPDEFMDVLAMCEDRGFVLSKDGADNAAARRWRFSALGLHGLRANQDFGVGVAALQPRDLPLEDQSVFEHLLALSDAGWTWRPTPTTLAAKRVLAPVSLPQNDEEAIGPLVFYSGLTISKEYMMCLLQADQLRLLGIAQIPHCIPLRGYTALLDGQPYVAPALQDRKRRILCDGAADADADGILLALPDREPEEIEPEDLGVWRALFGDDVDLPGFDPEAELSAVLTDGIDVVDAGLDVVDPPPPPPAPPPPPRRARRAVQIGANRSDRREPWGCFWFVPKDNIGRHGGFEVTCPFHKGTPSALRCKKFFPMDHALDQDQCQLRMKMWCLVAPERDRKRRHLRFDPRTVTPMDPAEVEMRRIDEAPFFCFHPLSREL